MTLVAWHFIDSGIWIKNNSFVSKMLIWNNLCIQLKCCSLCELIFCLIIISLLTHDLSQSFIDQISVWYWNVLIVVNCFSLASVGLFKHPYLNYNSNLLSSVDSTCWNARYYMYVSHVFEFRLRAYVILLPEAILFSSLDTFKFTFWYL